MKRSRTKADPRCLWCHNRMASPFSYWRAIDPGISNAFAAVCGVKCKAKPKGAKILEKVGP